MNAARISIIAIAINLGLSALAYSQQFGSDFCYKLVSGQCQDLTPSTCTTNPFGFAKDPGDTTQPLYGRDCNHPGNSGGKCGMQDDFSDNTNQVNQTAVLIAPTETGYDTVRIDSATGVYCGSYRYCICYYADGHSPPGSCQLPTNATVHPRYVLANLGLQGYDCYGPESGYPGGGYGGGYGG